MRGNHGNQHKPSPSVSQGSAEAERMCGCGCIDWRRAGNHKFVHVPDFCVERGGSGASQEYSEMEVVVSGARQLVRRIVPVVLGALSRLFCHRSVTVPLIILLVCNRRPSVPWRGWVAS
ncbi:hypothetical protein O3P69_000010 [Scylla paramamosain]|uniref:Uncharacterized protein n=1 Tax=Scylla paramamosain TaxID=85552 RepID=A0AAW0UWQ6_SCYPA